MSIQIIGVGDAGCAVINRIANEKLQLPRLLVINTSAENLAYCRGETLLIGNGFGAAGNPELGEAAAKSSTDILYKALGGADRTLIVAGMGGGTGTGATPYVVQMTKRHHDDITAIVSHPFMFEGTAREERANHGIANLKARLDDVVVVNFNNVIDLLGNRDDINLQKAFALGAKMLAWQTLARLI